VAANTTTHPATDDLSEAVVRRAVPLLDDRKSGVSPLRSPAEPDLAGCRNPPYCWSSAPLAAAGQSWVSTSATLQTMSQDRSPFGAVVVTVLTGYDRKVLERMGRIIVAARCRRGQPADSGGCCDQPIRPRILNRNQSATAASTRNAATGPMISPGVKMTPAVNWLTV
jgi:hypothetical protein